MDDPTIGLLNNDNALFGYYLFKISFEFVFCRFTQPKKLSVYIRKYANTPIVLIKR